VEVIGMVAYGSAVGSTPGEPRHICAFFHDVDEEYRVLVPLVKDGLDRGERAVHFIDGLRREQHLGRLAEAGIDVQGAMGMGQLEVGPFWDEVAARGRRFDPDSSLDLFERALQSGAATGYVRTNLLGEKGSADQSDQDHEDWFEFESRVNTVLTGYDVDVICAYDLANASNGARLVIDALRTHPVVILGEALHENPFYEPPDRFLRELRARRALREGVPSTA
jgi:hypothetical protein